MAAEGYFLQTMGKNFCEFEKCEPKILSYRIEIAEDGKELSQDQHMKYRGDIWTNVTSFNKFHVFSCPYEFVCPEPTSDPEELAKPLKPIFLKTLLQLIGVVIGALLILRLSDSSLIVSTLRGTSLDIVTFILVIFSVLSLCRESYFQGRLIRRLSKGYGIDHHAPWKKTYWISSVVWGAKTLLIAGIILAPLLLAYSYRYPMTADDTTLPIVRLENVETADGSDFDKSILREGYYSKGWSILAPKQFNSSESANLIDNHYTHIDNEYFKLTFPSTQKLIVNALVDRLNRVFNDINSTKTNSFNPEVIEHKDMDYLVYGYDSILLNNHVFAAKDGIVIHITYCGTKGKNELIKAVSNYFSDELKES